MTKTMWESMSIEQLQQAVKDAKAAIAASAKRHEAEKDIQYQQMRYAEEEIFRRLAPTSNLPKGYRFYAKPVKGYE